ncbi:retrovirus-related pol polyprotein from transposon TNT 1-94 [Tanacetum coccineum]|uniref:Retrovirus-related pol polyprotein from transposon TNT 1-94 n=1 Tax=Tanacetum coccineum TaxID=301880 RepID=A0ABQ5H116_9ASTR
MGLGYPKDSGFELTAFLDADHAGCIDTRKSTSGGIQFLGDKLVSWMSKRQNCTTMSSAEAETLYKLAHIFLKALPEDRFKVSCSEGFVLRMLTPAGSLELKKKEKCVPSSVRLTLPLEGEFLNIEHQSDTVSLHMKMEILLVVDLKQLFRRWTCEILYESNCDIWYIAWSVKMVVTMRHSMRMLVKDTRSQDGKDDKDNDKGSKSRSQSMKEQAYNKEQRERPRPHELNDKSNLIDLIKECHQ